MAFTDADHKINNHASAIPIIPRYSKQTQTQLKSHKVTSTICSTAWSNNKLVILFMYYHTVMEPACAAEIKSSQLQRTMSVADTHAKLSKALKGVGVQRLFMHIA